MKASLGVLLLAVFSIGIGIANAQPSVCDNRYKVKDRHDSYPPVEGIKFRVGIGYGTLVNLVVWGKIREYHLECIAGVRPAGRRCVSSTTKQRCAACRGFLYNVPHCREGHMSSSACRHYQVMLNLGCNKEIASMTGRRYGNGAPRCKYLKLGRFDRKFKPPRWRWWGAWASHKYCGVIG